MLPLDVRQGDGAERFFERIDARVQQLRQRYKTSSGLLARVSKASKAGNLQQLARALSALIRNIAEVRAEVEHMNASIAEFGAEGADATAILEQVALYAAGVGLSDVHMRSGTLFSFPVKLVARSGHILLDGKGLDLSRPSAIVEKLRELRDHGDQTEDGLLEATLNVYKALVRAKGRDFEDPVPIADVYAALVPLPASRSAYPESKFITDLYSLVSSSRVKSKSGDTLRLSGSTTTSGGRGYQVIARDGSEVVYTMLDFHRT